MRATPTVPFRQIRAVHSAATITLYQAYAPSIAEPAVAAGRFVPPFKRERMTWVKPSFLWMAYRCGWATKPGQERVLAVEITRAGFEWALERSCLSHYDPAVHPDRQVWADRLRQSPARIQWDPERSLRFEPLPYRSLQLGLAVEALERYVDLWTVAITDVTPLVVEVGQAVAREDLDAASALLPAERAYPLSDQLADLISATRA